MSFLHPGIALIIVIYTSWLIFLLNKSKFSMIIRGFVYDLFFWFFWIPLSFFFFGLVCGLKWSRIWLWESNPEFTRIFGKLIRFWANFKFDSFLGIFIKTSLKILGPSSNPDNKLSSFFFKFFFVGSFRLWLLFVVFWIQVEFFLSQISLVNKTFLISQFTTGFFRNSPKLNLIFLLEILLYF